MKYFPLISCLFFVIFSGCNEVKPKGEEEVRQFVIHWNDAHTQINAPYLERYYMDVVTYYGKENTKFEVQQNKNLLFQKFPDYTQRIANDELDIIKEAGSYVVNFTKQVNYDGVEADYISFLAVMNKNGDFKILREGLAKHANNLDAPIFPSALERNTISSTNRTLFGDFNGDGLSDYASVISPELILDAQGSDEVQCKGGCNSVIVFSNKDLKPITITGAYQSQLENLKDLNSDAADEIGFWDIKPKSKSLYVYNASTGTLLSEPIVINTAVHKNLDLIDVFKKTGPNKITVTYSAQVDGKWVLKSEVIRLD